MRYNKVLGGFYPEDSATLSWPNPENFISVTDEQCSEAHAVLIAGGSVSFQTVDGVDSLVIAPLTDKQVAANASALAWSAYRNQANALYTASNDVFFQCIESDVTLPKEWVDYRIALRVITKATSGDSTQALPVTPALPSGLV